MVIWRQELAVVVFLISFHFAVLPVLCIFALKAPNQTTQFEELPRKQAK
jgi:hypothetical protein